MSSDPNDEELCVIRRQLGLVEEGLAALRHEMQGRSAQQFELMAEPHVEMIRRLRAEIDHYLGIGRPSDVDSLNPVSMSNPT
jgi:hypothetical protein